MGDTLLATNRGDPTSLKADPLYAAIRTQANYLEITPWALILAVIAELNGAKSLDMELTRRLAFQTFHQIRTLRHDVELTCARSTLLRN